MSPRPLESAKGITRRHLMHGGGVTLLGSLMLTGCDALSTEPHEDTKDSRSSHRGASSGRGNPKEAPALATRVKAGKLPPVDQRLPRDPLVVKPIDRIGQYGGTWHSFLYGPSNTGWLYRTAGYDQLLTWDIEFKETRPNIATEVTPRKDGQEYVVQLREGIKWSDGKPFEADDLVFAVEDVLKDEGLTPAFPSWLTAGGKPVDVTKVDKYTVLFEFAVPNGLFTQQLATPSANGVVLMPKHYLSKFHKKYNPDVEALVEEENAKDWVELFQRKGGSIAGTPYEAEWMNADLPVLNAWQVTRAVGSGTRVTLERNPYYWKVDPAGSQLPYIDRYELRVLTDPDVVLLKASNGEFDMQQAYTFTLPTNKPVLARNRKKGNYGFFTRVSSHVNTMVISINMTHRDPVNREVFQDKHFRVGLSHAIDRQQVIDAAFQRQGSPWQCAPRKQSDFYLPGFGEQYTEHSPAKANDHLDEAGLDKRDGQGYRLRGDGERLQFQVEVTPEANPSWVDALEVIRGHWKQVGIEMRVKSEARSLFTVRKNHNKHDAVVWGGDGGLHGAILEPSLYFPYNVGSNFAMAWANWYNKTSPAMKPTEAPLRQMKLYDSVLKTIDDKERQRLFMEILKIAKEQFYVIGIALPADGYGIVKNTFHNVPRSILDAWQWPSPGPTRTEQYFTTDR